MRDLQIASVAEEFMTDRALENGEKNAHISLTISASREGSRCRRMRDFQTASVAENLMVDRCSGDWREKRAYFSHDFCFAGGKPLPVDERFSDRIRRRESHGG